MKAKRRGLGRRGEELGGASVIRHVDKAKENVNSLFITRSPPQNRYVLLDN